jgi:hypothetical protein
MATGRRKESVRIMYVKPTIHKSGNASREIQTKVLGSGDGTAAGFSRIQMPPSLEVVGQASELVQASVKGTNDGSNTGHSLIQCSPALEQ